MLFPVGWAQKHALLGTGLVRHQPEPACLPQMAAECAHLNTMLCVGHARHAARGSKTTRCNYAAHWRQAFALSLQLGMSMVVMLVLLAGLSVISILYCVVALPHLWPSAARHLPHPLQDSVGFVLEGGVSFIPWHALVDEGKEPVAVVMETSTRRAAAPLGLRPGFGEALISVRAGVMLSVAIWAAPRPQPVRLTRIGVSGAGYWGGKGGDGQLGLRYLEVRAPQLQAAHAPGGCTATGSWFTACMRPKQKAPSGQTHRVT